MRNTRMKQPHIEELPGYEELFQKLVEAMPLEKRLAGLAPEVLILALPVEVLRVLPAEYLSSLPGEVQEKIQKRLREAAH